MDRKRLRGWALAEGVLSASWFVEDGGDCSAASLEHCERLAAIHM
jgi:streptomycin 6-kinase